MNPNELIPVDGEPMFCIPNVDHLPPFLMTLVSATDHWMFVSSRGGLTAGRIDAERALFPYETDDRLHETHENTGPMTRFEIAGSSGPIEWSPFAKMKARGTVRNVYKNVAGTRVVFEEVHADLGLTFRYAWTTCDRFGFVRTSRLIDHGDAGKRSVVIVDGVQNVMPHGVPLAVQQTMRNLVQAYKRSEIIDRIGLYTLEALMSDRAEPAESLRATVAWSYGVDGARAYTSVQQSLDDAPASVSTGRPGAYVLRMSVDLAAGDEITWSIVLDVAQTQGDVERLMLTLDDTPNIAAAVQADVALAEAHVVENAASADGLMCTSDMVSSASHFANVLFNNMRGGVFADNGSIQTSDLRAFVGERNKAVHEQQTEFFAALPERLELGDLIERAEAVGDPSLERLVYEYLPLTFSRRHGGPSRPWNKFSIRVRDDEGQRSLAYEGNWRDIFQNWEALCMSFPAYIESVVAKFVNASTVDGHNPYRVTRSGIDWEVVEPDEPWSNIGYWGDHQIVYLLRLLEASSSFHPGRLQQLLSSPIFTYADVPYRMVAYPALLEDPRDSIRFDDAHAEQIERRVSERGTDGKLVHDDRGVVHVNLAEKLLVPALAKLSNLVVDGGIWMNTQRPEWNDANNALAGYGLSMVTLCYLRRYLAYMDRLLADGPESFEFTKEVAEWHGRVATIVSAHAPTLGQGVSDDRRYEILDALQAAYSDYRWRVYTSGFSGRVAVSRESIRAICRDGLAFLDHAIAENRRADGLYHAYNVLRQDGEAVAVDHLYEMLEGQVAVLSSGRLDGRATVELVDRLFESAMYRADQNTFMLYPARTLPGFLDKNRVPSKEVEANPLLVVLLDAKDRSVITSGPRGHRFAADLVNASALDDALAHLDPARYGALVETHGAAVVELYERVFDHRNFTGRSGTMYAYEGIGSIYWHMVSKLQLAVAERFVEADDPDVREALAHTYYRVRAGTSVSKSPEVWGAFVTDPYSHTPANAGAQQPGMTGQVKELVLTRRAELGVFAEDGRLTFAPHLLRPEELLDRPTPWRFIGLDGRSSTIELGASCLAFTVCQVPVVYRYDSKQDDIAIVVTFGAGRTWTGARQLDVETSDAVFGRTGAVGRIEVTFGPSTLVLERATRS